MWESRWTCIPAGTLLVLLALLVAEPDARAGTTKDVPVKPSTDTTAIFAVTDAPTYTVNADSEEKHEIASFKAQTPEGWVKWGKASFSENRHRATLHASPLKQHRRRGAEELYFYANLHGTFKPKAGAKGKPPALVFDIKTDKVAIDVLSIYATYVTASNAALLIVSGQCRPAPGVAAWEEQVTGIAASGLRTNPAGIFTSSVRAAPIKAKPTAGTDAVFEVTYDPDDARYHNGTVTESEPWLVF